MSIREVIDNFLILLVICTNTGFVQKSSYLTGFRPDQFYLFIIIIPLGFAVAQWINFGYLYIVESKSNNGFLTSQLD